MKNGDVERYVPMKLLKTKTTCGSDYYPNIVRGKTKVLD